MEQNIYHTCLSQLCRSKAPYASPGIVVAHLPRYIMIGDSDRGAKLRRKTMASLPACALQTENADMYRGAKVSDNVYRTA